MDSIQRCRLSYNGIFKYILIHVFSLESGESKCIIRGSISLHRHDLIYKDFMDHLKQRKVSEKMVISCMGGGFVTVDPLSKTIMIFGTSHHFGTAPHFISAAVIKNCYKDYDVRWV